MSSDWALRGMRNIVAPFLMMAASLAAAQTPPRGEEAPPPSAETMTGGGGPIVNPMHMLVSSSHLQAELQMDDEQLRKLQRVEMELRSKRSQFLQQLESGASSEQVRSARLELMEMDRGGIARVLTRSQLERFHQIMVQNEGACLALHDGDLSRSLRLQPAQLRQIFGSCRTLQAAMKAPPPANSRKERCAALEKLRTGYEKAKERTEAEIAAVLSDEQRADLRSMGGRPFQMDAPTPQECH
jgi:hypothetical protein